MCKERGYLDRVGLELAQERGERATERKRRVLTRARGRGGRLGLSRHPPAQAHKHQPAPSIARTIGAARRKGNAGHHCQKVDMYASYDA